MLTANEVVAAIHSGTCGGCMGQKVKQTPFCGTCLNKLPPHMREALRTTKIGIGKEKAYEDAKRCIVQRNLTASDVSAGQHSRR